MTAPRSHCLFCGVIAARSIFEREFLTNKIPTTHYCDRCGSKWGQYPGRPLWVWIVPLKVLESEEIATVKTPCCHRAFTRSKNHKGGVSWRRLRGVRCYRSCAGCHRKYRFAPIQEVADDIWGRSILITAVARATKAPPSGSVEEMHTARMYRDAAPKPIESALARLDAEMLSDSPLDSDSGSGDVPEPVPKDSRAFTTYRDMYLHLRSRMRKLSIRKLSDMTGYSPARLRHYRNRTNQPPPQVLAKIAEALGSKTTYQLEGIA